MVDLLELCIAVEYFLFAVHYKTTKHADLILLNNSIRPFDSYYYYSHYYM